MVRKWTLGGTGFALLATAFVVVACSSKDGDDDDSGNTGATGGSTPMAGKGGSSAGTSTTGGTGGSTGGTGGTTGGAGGTTGGTAGAATGGTAGSGVAGGAGTSAAGAAGAMGFACKGSMATCNTWSDFGTGTAAWWGSGDFTGGFSTFAGTGSMLTIDMANATAGVVPAIHITGTVGGYGVGFNFWFAYCSDLSAFTGVKFTLKGTTGYTTTPNGIDFQPQTNTNYPWQPRPDDKKGACTSPTPDNPWNDCVAPSKSITLSDTAQTILWSDTALANGKPAPFSATTSPKEIVGLQFQFPWAESATAYMVDVTLDDVSFEGAPMPISCGTSTGTGGMGAGGAGSGGAATGGAPMGGAGAGGAAAGTAGAAMGGAGAGGAGGGQGGQSGGGGRGGRGGGAGAP